MDQPIDLYYRWVDKTEEFNDKNGQEESPEDHPGEEDNEDQLDNDDNPGDEVNFES